MQWRNSRTSKREDQPPKLRANRKKNSSHAHFDVDTPTFVHGLLRLLKAWVPLYFHKSQCNLVLEIAVTLKLYTNIKLNILNTLHKKLQQNLVLNCKYKPFNINLIRRKLINVAMVTLF